MGCLSVLSPHLTLSLARNLFLSILTLKSMLQEVALLALLTALYCYMYICFTS